MEFSKEAAIGLGAGVLIAVAAATGPPWWWPVLTGGRGSQRAAGPIVGMSGGCPDFQVYARGSWDPPGTAIRSQPNVRATQVGSFPRNMAISVNGWVHATVAHPTNTAPWDSDVWYHLADGAGWVFFPGVRATPRWY